MKLLVAIFVVLLGTLPANIWNEGTSEDQQIFANEMMNAGAEKTNCAKGMLFIVSDKTDVYFVFDCEVVKDQKRM